MNNEQKIYKITNMQQKWRADMHKVSTKLKTECRHLESDICTELAYYIRCIEADMIGNDVRTKQTYKSHTKLKSLLTKRWSLVDEIGEISLEDDDIEVRV